MIKSYMIHEYSLIGSVNIVYHRKVSYAMPMMIERREWSFSFDGAMKDKLIYAALKCLGADVSKVMVLP